ncbi:hypothetical protein OV079_17025 [Nannocystis pusilla]|uniref:Uncharacterized protein n=1 Tax=Nannocystis pusilla TaxID=889268 RepID=A0A9X3IY59_9BACT|nr:hypothetical protein [Nannocystis pusilla]MCY1007229.1 hypothetical protein [Nannocystis pusilla]
MSRVLSIRSAARPFVARALRGPRGRRLLGLSVLLAALSAVLGTWLALGTGAFERDLRVGFDLEQSRHVQEERRFALIADSAEEAAALRAEVGRRFAGQPMAYDDAGYRVTGALEAAESRLRRAAYGEAPRPHRALQRDAILAFEAWTKGHVDADSIYGVPDYNWYDPGEVAALRAVVERTMSPQVEAYASPLSPVDALRMTGVLAGGRCCCCCCWPRRCWRARRWPRRPTRTRCNRWPAARCGPRSSRSG